MRLMKVKKIKEFINWLRELPTDKDDRRTKTEMNKMWRRIGRIK